MSRRYLPLALLALAWIGAGCSDDVRQEAQLGPPGVVERFLTPEPVPVAEDALRALEELVREEVERGSFPGAALAAGNRALVQRVSAFGRTAWAENASAADPDSTLYDLASLTKVVATTAAVMALWEDGRIDLDGPLQRYVPEFRGEEKEGVTIRQLLTHTSGVRAGVVRVEGETPAEVRRLLLSLPLALPPGRDVLYSDLGFVLLWLAAERAAGEPLPAYLRRRVWLPLGMESTAVGVPLGCGRCAPSLYLQERDVPYTGGSFDVLARRLDGVAGNAGAFSTARDLARFAAALANEGRLGEVRVFEPRTVREFTRPQPGAGTRALGWEAYCREGVVPDHRACEEVLAFGHSGVTGTSLWIDPETRTWIALLTNRSYLPRREADMQALRRRLFGIVAEHGAD
jgi:CubicO group peptidase (beta-lactamase class C family)